MKDYKKILTLIRNNDVGVVVIGLHAAIIQSMLDFDILSGKTSPSVIMIVTGGRKSQKFFFGDKEVLIPCVSNLKSIPQELKSSVQLMLNVQSGRRVLESTKEFFSIFPDAYGGTIFAENVPERHAVELIQKFEGKVFITGPASVGLLVSGSLKLGAIGGVDTEQIIKSHIATRGNIAVGSTSGGMTNELIRAVSNADRRVSFASAVGGDRFPVASLTDLFLLAENDKETDAFVYFGELGGVDEYEIIQLIKEKRFTKPLVAYIAGVIDEAFDEHVQFGHAKALVQREDESARAKRDALKAVGVIAPETFSEFLKELRKLPERIYNEVSTTNTLMNRTKSILSTTKVSDTERIPVFVKAGKLVDSAQSSFIQLSLEALLGRKVRSKTTVAFTEAVFSLLIDHGGHVSGAVNTMITARAGKDLVSSLSSGLLTIGPRFGGAINASASVWLDGVMHGVDARKYVEDVARKGGRISGIGHKKYRVGLPDPRVKALSAFATLLKKSPHYDFARDVEKITTGKNGSLILNVDGLIGALLLDILSECEGFTSGELQELIDVEFFNVFFVIPRSVGFSAHFMEQKRNDEGLFRLPDDLLFVRENDPKVKDKKK
ncbi:hypothetical protein EPO56_01145 [Patescibacteria group bacterium]|nr:MAG: hypothetical protein EPO56_01145 [Patescibacteria group bacterium]